MRISGLSGAWRFSKKQSEKGVKSEKGVRPHSRLIVIGSGPAGRRAAVQAAKLKKSVLVV